MITAKLRARKQQIALSEQSLSTRLSCALEKLCEPVMPEYIDDSNGPDLVGRRIVYSELIGKFRNQISRNQLENLR